MDRIQGFKNIGNEFVQKIKETATYLAFLLFIQEKNGKANVMASSSIYMSIKLIERQK